MVLTESCLISLVGGVLGVALGSAMLQALNALSPQFFPLGLDALAGPWMAGVGAVAAAIGLVSGFFPAVRAAQLSVIDGLRRVA
jgi:putative ABC transport system permease protein